MKQQDRAVQTRNDLLDDATIFGYICRDYAGKLRRSKEWLNRNPGHRMTNTITEKLEKEIDVLDRGIRDFRRKIGEVTDGTYAGIYEAKRAILASLHESGGLVGQVSVMTHWQSPAIVQSIVDNAGERSGKIVSHTDDYTRDQHAIGRGYEQGYRNAFIPLPKTVPVFSYATVSGMAALTTAAHFVLGETDPNSTVIVGTSCYFETKHLLHSLFSRRICVMDLSDRDALMNAVRTSSPSAIFADSIGNEPDMTRVDIRQLMADVSGMTRSQVYVVADISASSFRTRLIKGLQMPRRVTLIGIESQNKFLQYGLDRVTGGMVWGTGFPAMKLYEYRDHAGVNCPDMIIATLPTPHRETAALYLRRLERNAKLMADMLRDSSVVKRKDISVAYPDGPQFSGAYFMIAFPQSPLRTYEKFVRSVMKQAKHERIPLVEGTSFGMQTTRIYTVAKGTQYSRPFLRISPGTETFEEAERLAEFLIRHL